MSPAGGSRNKDRSKTDLLTDMVSGTSTIGSRIEWYSEVSSTNDVVWELICSDTPCGTVVLAEYQARGRGRYGTKWVSPRGEGILLSCGFKQTQYADSIMGGIGSLAVISLCSKNGIDGRAKWPNDVFVNNRKISGILVEQKTRSSIPWIILGIGININNMPETLPRDIASITTSFRIESEQDTAFDRIGLAAELIKALDTYYTMIVSGEAEYVCRKWFENLDIQDNPVILKNNDSGQRGVLTGIHPNGSFQIKTDNTTITESVEDIIFLTKEEQNGR